MKSKRYNIDDARYNDLNLIPETCSFCENKPIGLMDVRGIFWSRSRWICDDCRRK